MGIVDTINPTDSAGIQKKLSAAGANPSAHHLNAGEYHISSPLKLFSNTKITADPGAVFILDPDRPTKLFGLQVPVFGQASGSITNLDISGFEFRGNYQRQKFTSGDHGKGFGNCFGFSNISNSVFHDLNLGQNEGDEFRITLGNNLEFARIKSSYGGHDVIHVYRSKKIRVHDCNVQMRANNAVRIRASTDVQVNNNKFTGSSLAYAPAVQLENLESGVYLADVTIAGNQISGTFGPGIWGIATQPGSARVTISGNTFSSCGVVPASARLSGVGGMMIDGISGLNITLNKITGCKGYGIGLGSYVGGYASKAKGLTASITSNTITGTTKAYYPGTGSGAAIANLIGARYSVTARNNIMKNNILDYYGIKP